MNNPPRKYHSPTKEWLEKHNFFYGKYNTENKGYRYNGNINWFFDSDHHMEGWFIDDVKFYPKNENDVLTIISLLKPF